MLCAFLQKFVTEIFANNENSFFYIEEEHFCTVPSSHSYRQPKATKFTLHMRVPSSFFCSLNFLIAFILLYHDFFKAGGVLIGSPYTGNS